ncbi:MAG: M48 family metallopeptidase [Nocardioides sp.]
MSEPSPQPGLDRRAAWCTLAASWLVTAALALWLVPWDWVPGGALHPMSASELFTPAEIDRAEEFAHLRRLLGWSSYAVSLLVALALGLTPLGARLVRRVGASARWWIVAAFGVLALMLVGRIVTLPFGLLLRAQSVDYGLTNQGLLGWGEDQGKGLAVSWVATTILVWVIVGTARRSPRHWFARAGGVALLVTVAGSALYPVVVEPLFNTFTPMPDGPLRTAILKLADREGVQVNEVLVADASRRTTTLNAYVSGLGNTRRVVVYDNLLSKAPPAEVEVVVAHELTHAKNHDVLLGTGLGALASVGGVALLALLLDSRSLRVRADNTGPADPAVVALLMALVAVGSFASSPLVNSVSRAIEARADRGALTATHDAKDFIAMQRRLAVEAIQDPTPPSWSQFWFGSHPTVLQRAGLPAALGMSPR